MSIAFSILPIMLTLATGYVLRRFSVIPKEQWQGIETLSFRLLIPVVLVQAIAFSDLNMGAYGPFLTAILLTLGVISLLIFMLRLLSRDKLPNPSFTTLFQTTTRWNAFIALAAAELFAKGPAVAMLALAIAVLVPLINIVCTVVLAFFGTAKPSLRGVLITLAQNPLVQACALGFALKAVNITLPDFAMDTLDLIGRAALGVGILAVGAGLDLGRMIRRDGWLVFGVTTRLIGAPLLFIAVAHAMGLSALEQVTGVLVFAVPTANNGYILARKMGGDADLYASILGWQIALSLVTIPAFMIALS